MLLSFVKRVIGRVGGRIEVARDVALERTDDLACGAALGGPAAVSPAPRNERQSAYTRGLARDSPGDCFNA